MAQIGLKGYNMALAGKPVGHSEKPQIGQGNLLYNPKYIVKEDALDSHRKMFTMNRNRNLQS